MEIEGPHTGIPQPEQRRCAVPGQRLRDRENAALVVIYCPVNLSWVFYLDCDPLQAVLVGVDDVGPMVAFLEAGP